jgi:cold shock protein
MGGLLLVANGRALALCGTFFLLCHYLGTESPTPGPNTEGIVKMPTGTVKFFNESKGFGFIQPEGGGADSFVHISDVERSGMTTLREGQRVTYDTEQDQRGKMKACNLKAADGE